MAVLVRVLVLTALERFRELLPLLSTAFPFLLVLFLVYLMGTTVLSYRRLRHIPGPFLARISKLWVVRAVTSGRAHLTFHDTSIRYGPVSRIGPNQVLVSDPRALRRVLSVRAGYRRSEWYLGVRLEPGCDNVLSSMDEARHAEIRAKLVSGVGMLTLPRSFPIEACRTD